METTETGEALIKVIAEGEIKESKADNKSQSTRAKPSQVVDATETGEASIDITASQQTEVKSAGTNVKAARIESSQVVETKETGNTLAEVSAEDQTKSTEVIKVSAEDQTKSTEVETKDTRTNIFSRNLDRLSSSLTQGRRFPVLMGMDMALYGQWKEEPPDVENKDSEEEVKTTTGIREPIKQTKIRERIEERGLTALPRKGFKTFMRTCQIKIKFLAKKFRLNKTQTLVESPDLGPVSYSLLVWCVDPYGARHAQAPVNELRPF